MRILHVLDHSLPYFSGYSFRSDYLIRTQRRLGLDPVVVTSPKHETFRARIETVEGTDYYRISWPPFSKTLPGMRQAACVVSLSNEIARLASRLKVDIIHSHSPSLNGLAAGFAARRLRLPWIYEVRYFEEDAAVDRGKIKVGSAKYGFLQRLETQVLRYATRVVSISAAMREDLLLRGIDADIIDEVPNGVDTGFFSPREPDAELLARFGLKGKVVAGFIGSLYFYEGLQFLIDALVLLFERKKELTLLIAGEGEAEAALRQRVPQAYRDRFIFAGKVPHQDVRRYYSIMDLVVYPRIRSRLTELTTPLKPLEAMAMERMVIGSDVGGIKELLAGGEAGAVIAAEDPHSLADCLGKLAGDLPERQARGKAAREYVLRERDWEKIVSRYWRIYEQAIQC